MPKGKPNPQTIASKKFQEKAGYISKSYKIKKNIAEEYAEACDRAGVSQAGQLSKMMKQFIDET
ncbi:MAG: chemotaxis protein [Lachnospiraceae bacterium]|nr:chemotaxis protein [Lachnospiraceae bacterium]